MEVTPSEQTVFGEEQREENIREEYFDDVSFHRGLGASGRRIALVARPCDSCGHPYQVRMIHVRPEERDAVNYFCNKPGCEHYHDGELDWAINPTRR